MSKKILIIDDDLTSIKLLEARLVSKGFEVCMAINGEQGIAQAEAQNPDMIILDVEMPRMNGYTFLSKLKKIDSLQSIPVIVSTAHQENQPIFELKGVVGYLIKPLNFDDLFEKIDKILTN
ncbi:MAG: response regulator [Candidatus Zapsychrus exili]|nr:response regulator [Candidatus Zapsychrus exili]